MAKDKEPTNLAKEKALREKLAKELKEEAEKTEPKGTLKDILGKITGKDR